MASIVVSVALVQELLTVVSMLLGAYYSVTVNGAGGVVMVGTASSPEQHMHHHGVSAALVP